MASRMPSSYAIWDELKYFNKDENWGDPYKMDIKLLRLLDQFRAYVGKPIIINCGYEKRDTRPSSYHNFGKAVDCYVVGLELIDQFIEASRFNFMGIGMYPDWNQPGLHLDTRIDDRKSYWIRLNNDYTSLDWNNIRRFV